MLKEIINILILIAAIVLGLGAMLFALSMGGVETDITEDASLHIYYTDSVFILYASEDVRSVEGLAFEVVNSEARRLVTLADFSETAKLSQQNFPTPVCVRFVRTQSLTINLPECANVTNVVQLLDDAELFWVEGEDRPPVTIRILSGNKVLSQCEPNEFCVFSFVPTTLPVAGVRSTFEFSTPEFPR